MRLLCALLFVATACHDDHDHNAYPTYQACFDEHINVESLPLTEAIVICCLDHPIDTIAAPACGATKSDCEAFLAVNLTSGATAAEKSAGCDEYIVQKDQ